MARRAEVDWSYIHHIEHGQNNPTLATLLNLARALDIDLAELVKDLTPGSARDSPSSQADT